MKTQYHDGGVASFVVVAAAIGVMALGALYVNRQQTVSQPVAPISTEQTQPQDAKSKPADSKQAPTDQRQPAQQPQSPIQQGTTEHAPQSQQGKDGAAQQRPTMPHTPAGEVKPAQQQPSGDSKGSQANLPTAGPADSVAMMLAASGLVGVLVAYRRSRCAV